jgi:hypothetical protein
MRLPNYLGANLSFQARALLVKNVQVRALSVKIDETIRPFRSLSLVASLIVPLLVLTDTARATDDEIGQMRLAAHQLAGAQLSSGLLDFDIDFLVGQGGGSGNTDIDRTAFIARQAAAAWSLAKYLAWSKDSSVSGPVQQLIATFGSLSLPVGKSSAQRWLETTRILSTPIGRYELRATLELLGLLYRPTGDGKLLAYEGGYATTWAGSTALALGTELEYFRATGDNRFANLRSSWLNGLLALHVPSRGFREYPGSLEEAAYANGETWLALATYTALFPADAAVNAMLKSYDDYVLGKYSAEPNVQFYSWGMMAAAQRLATTSDSKFTDFIAAQVSHFVDQKFSGADARENSCSFVEGLAAAGAVLVRHDEYRALREKLLTRINREMTKNRELQITIGMIQIEFPGGTFRSTRLAEYVGAFLSDGGNPYVRIDITAHCLSALVELRSIEAARR